MKNIEVVASVIFKDNQVFATQRGYGEFNGWWEFPGGKIEVGETKQDALIREIKEELDVDIIVEDLIKTVNYDYPNFHLTMHCFRCFLKGDQQPKLLEHESARWVSASEINNLNWLPADLDIVKDVVAMLYSD